jgi:hypothetical protein
MSGVNSHRVPDSGDFNVKKLSNGQWHRVRGQNFEVVTGLNDGDKILGAELLEKELGTRTMVYLGGTRKVSGLLDLDGEKLPMATMIVTPEGEVLLGVEPNTSDSGVRKQFVKFLREFSPNGHNPVYHTQVRTVTIDSAELLYRRASRYYYPDNVTMGAFGPERTIDLTESGRA